MRKIKQIVSMIMLVSLLVAGVWFVGQRNNTVLAEESEAFFNMLSVKCQTKQNDNGSYNVRVVTTVENTADTTVEQNTYEKVGFEVTILNQAGNNSASYKDIVITEGYERIIKSNESGIEYNFSPMVFDEQSGSFATCTLTNIPASYKDNGILIRPYVVHKDSNQTKTYGTSKYFMIQDGSDSNPDTTDEILTLPLTSDEYEQLKDGNCTASYSGNSTNYSVEIYKVDVNGVSDEYGYARISVDSTTLPSVSQWTISNGTQSVTKEFRNLYSKLSGSGSNVVGDQTWYNSNEKTHMIVTAADLYGLAELVNLKKTSIDSSHTIHIVNDIVVNTESVESMKAQVPTYVWTPIGLETAFGGNLDGNGHTISGIYINDAQKDNYTSDFAGRRGLFYQARNCTIQNLKLLNSYMSGTNSYCGSIAGYFSGTMKNVYSDAYVNNTTNTGENVGGLVGYVRLADKASTIENCQYAGYMDTTDNVAGGIVGMCSGANVMTMTNCLVTGTLNLSDGTGNRFGGIIGSFNATSTTASTMENCIFNGTQTGYAGSSSQKHGLIIGQIAVSTLNLTDCYAYKNSNTMMGDPLGESQSGTIVCNGVSYTSSTGNADLNDIRKTSMLFNYTYKLDNSIWCDTNEGLRLIEFVNNSERFDLSWYTASDNNYTLEDGWQLIGMSYLSNQSGNQFSGKTITLSDDITINTGNVPERALQGDDTLIVWTPIGLWKDFKGTFNGDNHSISGLYINDKEKDNCGTDYKGHRGLFYKATDSTIQNLRLLNSYIESNGTTECGTAGNSYAESGSIAGVFSGTLQNVYSNAYIKHSYLENVGGLVGKVDLSTTTSNISNCQFAGTIVSTGNVVGGIVGQCTGATGVMNMTDCLVTGTLNMQDGFGNRYGGVVGSFNATNASTASVMRNCIFNGVQTGVKGTSNDDTSVGYGLIIGQVALGDAKRILRLENCYAFKANTVCSDYLGNMQTGIIKYGDQDTEQYTGWGQSNNFNKAPYTKTTGDDVTVTGCNLDNTIWEDSSKGPILKIFK